MGAGASSSTRSWLCSASAAELGQAARGLNETEREKLRAAVQLLEVSSDPDLLGDAFVKGEEVLFLWSEPSGGVPDFMLQQVNEQLLTIAGLDGRWEQTIFERENPDGTLVLKPKFYGSRKMDSIERELVRRYPYGMRPPDLSGITLGQLQRLHAAHRVWLEEPRWNEFTRQMQMPTMYDVVPAIIKPATERTRGSYVELYTQKAVEVFVSHWWGGEFVEFVASLSYSAEQLIHDDVGGLSRPRRGSKEMERSADSIVFWICSFANAQWTVNLGSSLRESPFEIALASKTCKAVVMVMDEMAMPLTRIWCIYEVLRTGVLRHPFYVATQHGILVGERVRESPPLAASLLALAERLSELRPQHAAASNAQDHVVIINEVSSAVGIEQFALAVQASLFEVLRKAGYAVYSRNWRLNFKLLQVHREAVREVYWLQPGTNRNRRAYRPPTEALPGRTRLHRAAQEGDMEALRQEFCWDQALLEKVRVALEELQPLKRSFDNYRERMQKEAEVRGLNDQVMDREDELGQKALHLAARYCRDAEALELMAQQWPHHVRQRDKFGRLPLHRAAESGCAAALAAILPLYDARDLAKELDKKQHSCLDLAVLSGSTEAVDFLLQKRAVATHSNKRTPLHLAAQWNHVEILQDLAARGFPDTGDCDGTHPLHLATRFGHEEAAKALIGLRADVAAKTVFGRTSLHWAALNGHVKMAELLLESRSPPDERDGAGWTAFHWALRRGHDECARALQRGGVDVHSQDLRSGRNALHIAAASDSDPMILEDLLSWGLKLLETDVAQKLPLHLAAQWGKIQHVAKLLQMNSDVEARCSHQRTALHLAARRGHASVCRKLAMEGGADLYAADANGAMPFTVASRFGQFDAVLALIGCQIDANSKEKDGMTALHWAGHFGQTPVIRSLIELRADVTAVTRYGRNPLHCAAIAGQQEAAIALIKRRSDVHHRQKDGWMPIHLASRFNHRQVIMALVEYRADPNARGVNGKTPGQCYAQQGGSLYGVFDELQQDDSGRNALHTAAIHGHELSFSQYHMTEFNPAGVQLINGLAIGDAQGRTPLHLAAAFGRHRVVKEILERFVDDDGNFNKRWHRPKSRYHHFRNGPKQDEEEEEESGPEPPLPILVRDRKGRLPLHSAAQGGFPMVVGQLVSFMMDKLDCSVADILRPDDQGASALDLACRRRDDAAARRLAEKLSVELPATSKWQGKLLANGDEVCIKQALQLGEHELPKGMLGRVKSASDSAVELQFTVGTAGYQRLTCTDFSQHCVGKRRYIVNASNFRKRLKGNRNLRLAKQAFMPASLQQLNSTEDDDAVPELPSESSADVEEGCVLEGFDLGDGWLQLCNGGWLPTHIQSKSSRGISVLTTWSGPSIKIGDVVKTIKELTLPSNRVLKKDSIGIVQRLISDAARVKFDGAKGGSAISLPDTAFAEHVEVTGYRCIMEEPPMEGPPEGFLVKHTHLGCGAVQLLKISRHDSERGWKIGFSVIFGDGSRSQLPADRRGIRLIAVPPRPEEVAAYLQLKEQTLRRKIPDSAAA